MISPSTLLLFSGCKFPIGNCHYITGANIGLFSNFLCIENSLKNLTCNTPNILLNPFIPNIPNYSSKC
ncbi:MAG: hypothetical protein IJ809_00165 [Clostridia bacterium]|nr:hypothetical protein [Clostridia bacterium]